MSRLLFGLVLVLWVGCGPDENVEDAAASMDADVIIDAGDDAGSSSDAGIDGALPDAGSDAGPDLTPPSVVAVTPSADATDAEPVLELTATFSEAIDPATLTTASFQLWQGDTAVAGAVSYDTTSLTARFTPEQRLPLRIGLRALLTTTIADVSGNTLALDQAWVFTIRPGRWGAPTFVDGGELVQAKTLVMAPGGQATAAFTRGSSGAQDLWMRGYEPSGGWSPPERLVSDADIGLDIRLATTTDGGVLAVWPQENAAGVQTIRFSAFEVGSGWSGPVVVSDETVRAGQPDLVTDSAGNATMVWLQWEDATALPSVWGSDYEAASGWATGALVGPRAVPPWSSASPRIAGGAAGSIAVWEESVAGGRAISASLYAADAGWSAPERVGGFGGDVLPHAAMDGEGNAIVVWHAGSTVQASVKRAGGDWSASDSLGAAALSGRNTPAVQFDATGNALAVWHTPGSRIMASRYTPATGWGPPAFVDGGNGAAVRFAVDPAGNAVAVFSVFDEGVRTLWTNDYTPASGWGTARPMAPGAVGLVGRPMVGIDDLGRAIAFWGQLGEGTTWEVWSSVYE